MFYLINIEYLHFPTLKICHLFFFFQNASFALFAKFGGGGGPISCIDGSVLTEQVTLGKTRLLRIIKLLSPSSTSAGVFLINNQLDSNKERTWYSWCKQVPNLGGCHPTFFFTAFALSACSSRLACWRRSGRIHMPLPIINFYAVSLLRQSVPVPGWMGIVLQRDTLAWVWKANIVSTNTLSALVDLQPKQKGAP